jgi:hypothetical protein
MKKHHFDFLDELLDIFYIKDFVKEANSANSVQKAEKTKQYKKITRKKSTFFTSATTTTEKEAKLPCVRVKWLL